MRKGGSRSVPRRCGCLLNGLGFSTALDFDARGIMLSLVLFLAGLENCDLYLSAGEFVVRRDGVKGRKKEKNEVRFMSGILLLLFFVWARAEVGRLTPSQQPLLPVFERASIGHQPLCTSFAVFLVFRENFLGNTFLPGCQRFHPSVVCNNP